MNEFLQQLLSMGPAIGAGIGGNGPAMQAFMEGFQKTRAQMEQRARLKQQDQLSLQDRQMALEDRQRGIANTAADRARAAQVAQQQDALRMLSVPGHLVEAGAGAETPEDAKALIESLMPTMMKAFGQEAMAFGQPAVEQAQKVITGRQKKQVEVFVDAALKVDHILNNPDTDPELTNLPEHIAKIVGKPTARLSELQTYAQLPVGKPQGKTRVPAAAGSMEEFSDPATTPERKAAILADRKAYMQSDDRPRITVNTGGAYPPAQQRRIDAIVKAFDLQPIVKRTQVMSEGVGFAQALSDTTTNPADDQALIYAFAKVMDADSVVREGEYATVQKYAQSWAERFKFDMTRIWSNTQFLTPEARRNMKATLMTKWNVERRAYNNLRNEYGRKIERITGKTGGVDELTDFGAAFPQETQAETRADGKKAATVNERRKFGTELREWNGSEWVLVKVKK